MPSSIEVPRPIRPIDSGARDRESRLQLLRPFIRELLAQDLVVRSEAGGFLLSPDVQEALEQVADRGTSPTAQVVVGRSCEACGVFAVTRRVDGVRRCQTCQPLSNSSAAVQSDVAARTQALGGSSALGSVDELIVTINSCSSPLRSEDPLGTNEGQ